MKKNKYREKNTKNVRCIISGKILNGQEALSIKNIDVYIEKQAPKYEKILLARQIARTEREKEK